MTVTVDAVTENVRTLTTSPQTFSHAGAASGVKGFVLALVHGTSSTDHVSAASYGGVALTRIQRNVDTATEPGAAELWFLGSGVPQGTQTVSYTPGATTDDFHAVAITLLGAADLQVVDQDGVSENVANPSVTLQYSGRTCMAFAALYGGGAAPSSFTENANCTRVHDHDLGAFYSVVCRQTTAGSADFAVGGTAATDDVAFAAIAVSEVQQPTGTIAVIEADDTSSASGTVTVTGTVGVTETADTSSASGTVEVTGTVAVTEAADTAAASGEVGAAGITGTVAVTEAADSASVSGLVTVAGTAAPAEGNDTSAASGAVIVSGTGAPVEADDASSVSGLVTVSGTAAITEAADTADASGYAGAGISGTAAITEADDSASAEGAVGEEEAAPVPAGGGWWIPSYVPPIKKKKKKKKKKPEEEEAELLAAAREPLPADIVSLMDERRKRRNTMIALLLAA